MYVRGSTRENPIGKQYADFGMYGVSVRFVPEGEGYRTRRDPVIASPPRRHLIGRHRDFVGSLGWRDLKRDLRDFTSRFPPGRNIGLQ